MLGLEQYEQSELDIMSVMHRQSLLLVMSLAAASLLQAMLHLQPRALLGTPRVQPSRPASKLTMPHPT